MKDDQMGGPTFDVMTPRRVVELLHKAGISRRGFKSWEYSGLSASYRITWFDRDRNPQTMDVDLDNPTSVELFIVRAKMSTC